MAGVAQIPDRDASAAARAIVVVGASDGLARGGILPMEETTGA